MFQEYNQIFTKSYFIINFWSISVSFSSFQSSRRKLRYNTGEFIIQVLSRLCYAKYDDFTFFVVENNRFWKIALFLSRLLSPLFYRWFVLVRLIPRLHYVTVTKGGVSSEKDEWEDRSLLWRTTAIGFCSKIVFPKLIQNIKELMDNLFEELNLWKISPKFCWKSCFVKLNLKS